MSRPRTWLLASAVSAAFALAALLLRPLWRDEYWALYFSAPSLSFAGVLQAHVSDTHPPAYFLLLRAWDGIWDNDLWARALNVPLLAGGFALAWLAGRDRRAETALYLALAATSFWLVFFAVEARNYALIYALVVPGVVVQRRALEDSRAASPWILLWAAMGIVVADAHYYGSLWIGLTGAAASLVMLASRRPGAFLAWGLATAVATLPTAWWLVWASAGFRHTMEGYAVQTPPLQLLSEGLEQLLRGLIVKTFIANLPLAIAGFAGIAAVARSRDRNDAVQAAGIVGVILIALLAHTLVTPVIKERSFIVIIPPLLYLAARALPLVEAGEGWTARAARWAPYAAVVAPLLFAPEHFKDRERFGEVRAAIAQAGDCDGAPVLAYNRTYREASDFTPFLTRRVLAGATAGRGSLDFTFVTGEPEPDAAARVLASSCAVKAVLLALPRGERAQHAEARAALAAAGLPIGELRELRLGGGRNLVYLTP